MVVLARLGRYGHLDRQQGPRGGGWDVGGGLVVVLVIGLTSRIGLGQDGETSLHGVDGVGTVVIRSIVSVGIVPAASDGSGNAKSSRLAMDQSDGPSALFQYDPPRKLSTGSSAVIVIVIPPTTILILTSANHNRTHHPHLSREQFASNVGPQSFRSFLFCPRPFGGGVVSVHRQGRIFWKVRPPSIPDLLDLLILIVVVLNIIVIPTHNLQPTPHVMDMTPCLPQPIVDKIQGILRFIGLGLGCLAIMEGSAGSGN